MKTTRNNKILILPGDGIGPEVTRWGLEALKAINKKHDLKLEFNQALIGHASIQQNGQALTDEVLEEAKNSAGILLGAIGDPSYTSSSKVRPEQGLLKIRKEMGLFANIRPVKIFPSLLSASPLKPRIVDGVNLMFFRELTGGIYFGKPRGRDATGKIATDTCVYNQFEIERIAKMAFETAQQRSKKLVSVDKVNVLETSKLWQETVNQVATDFPEVELSHQLIDSMSMKLIASPKDFDVILTSNLFGDILTDEASQITGSIGMLASSSVGSQNALFEPIHGSAPDIAGQNLANPIATILSAGMLLEYLGLPELQKQIEKSVSHTLDQGWRTADIKDIHTQPTKVLSTDKMGEKILENLD
jgi:3-isopropylmalate dehydrogenase